MKFRILYFILLIFIVNIAKAQDPHFSQFFASPLTLNPAFTGKFNGDIRLAANYRNQWPTINRAYVTSTASVDFPILRKTLPSIDNWGLGFAGYTDKSAAGAVAFNYFSLSTAYHKGLDEDGFHQIGTGFQVTYSNMNIYTSQLKFEDQLTPFGFTGITQETFGNSTLKQSYVDVNAGVLYSGSKSEYSNFYAGVSMYHINRPKQQFTDNGSYLLNPRFTLHSGGYFPVGAITTLHLSGLFSSQAGAQETVVGGAMQFAIGDQDTEAPTNFYAGSWYRLGDALIPYVGLEFNGFRFGATYDVNTSDLKTASQNKGGIEISLIYIKQPPGAKGVPCPKF